LYHISKKNTKRKDNVMNIIKCIKNHITSGLVEEPKVVCKLMKS